MKLKKPPAGKSGRMIILAPDSFKGSLPALAVAQAMERGIRRVMPQAALRLLPMADGGEGTLDAVLAARQGRRLQAEVQGAGTNRVTAAFGLLDTPGDRLAVLEAAQVVGLTLQAAHAPPVELRSSLGVGELFRHCLDKGVRRFMIGLGGTSTNDGGAGVLRALGVRLLDNAGRAIAPTPAGLAELATVDFSSLDERIKETEITLLSDVTNPLVGETGATAVFGPQKGITAAQVPELDARLRRLGELGDHWLGRALSAEPGTGAAGGLGYAFQLLGARNRLGAEVVCELFEFDAALQHADWVLTGEGHSNAQTLAGKAPYVVARRAQRYRVPVTLVSGGIDRAGLPQLVPHFAGCFSIMFAPTSLSAAIAEAPELIADCVEQLARLRRTLISTHS